WLVQQGVDVATVNSHGDTAADDAERAGYSELGAWLRDSEYGSAPFASTTAAGDATAGVGGGAGGDDAGNATTTAGATGGVAACVGAAACTGVAACVGSAACAGSSGAVAAVPAPAIAPAAVPAIAPIAAPAIARAIQGDESYKNRKGRVLFFNYTKFEVTKVSDRTGAEEDTEAIINAFGTFDRKYEVIVHDSRTSQETQEIFQKLKQDISLYRL
ncbi:unnamed protein product, partial [Meganyctiphanes norvegica]